MATTYKVLGQSYAALATETDAYTVPSSTQAVVSTMAVCNLDGAAATYRIAIRPGGASIASQHYIAYNATLPANDTIAITLGITLNATDVITVYSSSGNVAFSIFGSEIA